MAGSERRAWAFRYEPGEDEAPVLVASGRGLLAERILEIAREAGVMIESNPEAARILDTLRVGDWIPEELYGVFVEILARLYGLEDGHVDRRNGQ